MSMATARSSPSCSKDRSRRSRCVGSGREQERRADVGRGAEKPKLIACLESIGAAEQGVDPFLIAARKGDMAALEAALARRVDLEMTDSGKRTAMMRAAMYGRSAAITRLAKAGANVNPRFEVEFDTPAPI